MATTKLTEPFVPEGPMPNEGINYPKGYVPSEKEEYMNDNQRAYFRDILEMWKSKIEEELEETISHLQNGEAHADLNDQASVETDQSIELRTRDRERKLILKIEEAIQRIDDGEFGYCTETGDPIGVKRLLARPIATLCIEAKRMQEQEEKGYAG